MINLEPIMKRHLSLPLFFLFLFFSQLSMALDMRFNQVAPGIYAYIGDTGLRTYANEGMNGNAGFIVTEAGVVVVDSGSSYQVAQKIHAAIRQVTQKPVKYVINTGGQDHRWLGNGYFKAQGAEIIAHTKAVADMAERGGMQMNGLKGELKEKFAGTEAVLPTRTFEQELRLDLGGRDIRILHFQPAHTPGDSVVWLPGESVLFSGDIVFVDRLLGVLPFSSTSGWLASFDAMSNLLPRLIVPGHGEICGLAKAKRETGDYLRLLLDHMVKSVNQGKDLQQAIDSLDQSAYANLPNYDLLKGGNASRVYLEAESL
jgi:glyoxylase-like metal-dependent hydrolase (beta-lactamase superfamily II)